MRHSRLHRPLQSLLFVLGLVAVGAGLLTVLTGSAGMPGDSRATVFSQRQIASVKAP